MFIFVKSWTYNNNNNTTPSQCKNTVELCVKKLS